MTITITTVLTITKSSVMVITLQLWPYTKQVMTIRFSPMTITHAKGQHVKLGRADRRRALKGAKRCARAHARRARRQICGRRHDVMLQSDLPYTSCVMVISKRLWSYKKTAMVIRKRLWVYTALTCDESTIKSKRKRKETEGTITWHEDPPLATGLAYNTECTPGAY